VSAAPVNPPPDPEARFRLEKLELEIAALRRQIKIPELVRVLTGPVAVIGVVVTVILGSLQLHQANQSRDDERFDKAISRLAAANPAERLSGIAGVELYLDPQQKTRHRPALRFLVGALAVEPDPTVRGQIIDTLGSLKVPKISQADLDDTLEHLRNRNRDLYAQLQAAYLEKLRRDGGLKLPQNAFDETHILPNSEAQFGPLRATALAIVTLIRHGARTKDLSGIYCVDCDFTGIDWEMINPNFAKVADFADADPASVLDLSGVDFDRALLKRANLIGVNLRGASFDGADLLMAKFAGADLSGAKLTDFQSRLYPLEQMQLSGDLLLSLPDFTCANLSHADFTKSILFAIYSSGENGFYAGYPTLHKANLAHANLGQVYVMTVRPVEQGYNPSPPEAFNQQLFKDYGMSGGTTIVTSSPGTTHEVMNYLTGPDFALKEPFRPEFSLGTQIVFSNLYAARNVYQTNLPEGLKAFMQQNQKHLANAPNPTPCTPRD
jgi:uncharacterized protein YjbI with pentapeptide repeats